MRNIKIRLLTLFLLLASMNSCLKEDTLQVPFTGYAPADINDGWEISTPEQEGMDPAALTDVYTRLHNDPERWQVRSLLVVRNGKLVAESYPRSSADRTRQEAIWSCTKSFTSLMTGLAIEKGFIRSTADSAARYLPEYFARYPDKKPITLENLLNMQGGIAFSNDGASGNTVQLLQENVGNSLDYVLGLPLKDKPGTVFAYNDGLPQVMSGVIGKAVGKPMDEFGREHLFAPLGITNYTWHRYKDVVTFGAFGLKMVPRDLAKVIQCVMDSGRWQGKQILPAAWLAQSIQPRVYETYLVPYGNYWWIDPARGCYFMNGHGGQFIFAVPSRKLAVIITSEPNTQDNLQFPLRQGFRLLDEVVQTIR